MHQLGEYNDESSGAFMRPLMVAEPFNKNWSKNTAGLSEEEVQDLEQARAVLDNYGKVYSIFEYSSEITRMCNMVEIRICANNPSIPMNIYRNSNSSTMREIFPEIEKCLEAYYGLIDDCAAYPDWQKKVQKELGGSVSYLALALDENSRDAAVEISESFARFDSEKQLYFK